ncbi:MAG: hypothetical protein ABIH72_03060 [archaeon]
MIVKILGALDILAAIFVWIFVFFNLGSSLLLLVGFYLLIKGSVFLISLDILSLGDIFASLIIFAALNWHLPKVLGILVILYLLIKGAMSLL